MNATVAMAYQTSGTKQKSTALAPRPFPMEKKISEKGRVPLGLRGDLCGTGLSRKRIRRRDLDEKFGAGYLEAVVGGKGG